MIVVSTSSDYLKDNQEMAQLADAVELRFDLSKKLILNGIKVQNYPSILDTENARNLNKPLMLTIRSRKEGGQCEGTKVAHMLIKEGIKEGWDYIDLEYKRDGKFIEECKKIKKNNKIILSYHTQKNLGNRRLETLIKKMAEKNPEYIKIVLNMKSTEDALKALYLRDKYYFYNITILSSGECNEFMRAVNAKDKKSFSFGYGNESKKTSEWLMPIKELYHLKNSSSYYGLIGWPLKYSLSPKIFQSFSQMINAYLPYFILPVKSKTNLGMVIENLRQFSFGGINVTFPYKEHIIPHIDIISPEVERTGVVSTVTMNNAYSIGNNNDYKALEEVIKKYNVSGDAIVLGTGATSKTSIVVLADLGYKVYVKSRKEKNVEKLMKKFPIKIYEEKEYSIAINTTIVGSLLNNFPYKLPSLTKNALAIDFAYNESNDTPFIIEMKKHAEYIVNGKELVLNHAIHTIKNWLGNISEDHIAQLKALKL
ncbi:MAG: type I 3-dehydroquinate dehydratase [Thermoplasmata archaeon]